jgi:hypothetical protein
MNVLAKPQLENTILLDELIDIMENLGIPDDGGNIETGVQQMDSPQAQNSEPEPVAQPQEKEKKKKNIDVSVLSDDSKTLLYNFLIYLEQESMTVNNFFESVKYEQMVKTKKKEMPVDIVAADDFFRLLNDQDEIMDDVSISNDLIDELKSLL